MDSEDARREALQAAMRQARQRARNLTRIRLGVALGLVAAILLIVSIVARQTYTSQVSGISAESTAIAQRATAAAAATATTVRSQLNSYRAIAPGPNCDQNTTQISDSQNPAGYSWSLNGDNNTAVVDCHAKYTTFTVAADYGNSEALLSFPSTISLGISM